MSITYNHGKLLFKAAKEKLNTDLDKAFLDFLADGKRFQFRIKEKLAYTLFRNEMKYIRWNMDRIYFKEDKPK